MTLAQEGKQRLQHINIWWLLYHFKRGPRCTTLPQVFKNNLNCWAFSPVFKEYKALHLEYRSLMVLLSLPKTICSMKEIQTDSISRQQRQTDLVTLTGIYKQNKM